MEPFIGEIRLLPFTFAPEGWLLCDGTEYPVSQQFVALASILGTIYGGSQTTFKVPDLRGRSVLGAASAAGSLTAYALGKAIGADTVTLNATNMPPHNHPLNGAISNPTLMTTTPTGSWLSHPVRPLPTPAEIGKAFQDNLAQASVPCHPATLSPFLGQGQPHANRQPYLALQYCIAWSGDYPIRS
jgi:microcystin-dependent protein